MLKNTVLPLARRKRSFPALASVVTGFIVMTLRSFAQDPGSPMQNGMVANQRGDYNAAIAAFTQVIQQNPARPRAYFGRGFSYFKKGDDASAVTDFTQAIQLSPRMGSAYILRADAYARRGDDDKAIADFSQAIQLGQQNSHTYDNIAYAENNLAWILATCPRAELRDGKKAVADAMAACDSTRWQNPLAVNTLAAAYAQAGDFTNAVKWQSEFLQTGNLEGTDLASAQARLAQYQARQPNPPDSTVVDESAFALSNSETVIGDYVAKQTAAENKVRDRLLGLTPIGSSPEQVLKVIADVLHKTSYGYKKNYFSGAPGSNENMYIAGNIGILYDHQDGLFMVGTDTAAEWYFDAQDRLFNIVVETHAVGP